MVVWRFFMYVKFICHFVLMQIVHNWVSCSTGLAMLARAKQGRANPHATVFSQGQNNHAPSLQYAAIYAVQLHSKPEASSYWPFEWPTPDQYSRRRRSNFFRPVDLVSCILCVPTHAQKACLYLQWKLQINHATSAHNIMVV